MLKNEADGSKPAAKASLAGKGHNKARRSWWSAVQQEPTPAHGEGKAQREPARGPGARGWWPRTTQRKESAAGAVEVR